jgi:hypothetical protein
VESIPTTGPNARTAVKTGISAGSNLRYGIGGKGKLTGRTVRRRARAAIITPAVIFLVFISV